MLDWAAQIKASVNEDVPDAPGFPPEVVQARFVGRSGVSAIEEVIPFAEIVYREGHIQSTSRVLDFGVGWGRIARLFQKAVDEDNLFLADVDADALKLCSDLRVKGFPIHVTPGGNLPLEDRSLDVVYSYSVFSHLSENAARHWFSEIFKTLKSSGVLVFTTQSLRFLDLVVACHNKSDASEIERSIGSYMGANPEKAVIDFKAGKLAFSDVNGAGGGGVLSGEFYGWAAIPLEWFKSYFGDQMDLLDYIDDPSQFEQAVIVARKK
ncbi:class I SAM-dependent methyltransferase [Brucella intermedia]|uniref:class I SAM-dependent methyltransferase n=1 Tax=Brucella intermedia TaxID=94625 RepID=UPI0015902098|nr:class I SAM-dependent methyltransferase [Brucella intermedia]